MINNYELYNEDKNIYPIVISIPHSGTYVPEYIREKMLPEVVLTNTDWFLPELYSFFKDMGVTVIASNISRYVIDLNRSLELKSGGDYHNLVYGYTTQGKPIYKNKIETEDVKRRIEDYYIPYYNMLDKLLTDKCMNFQQVLLLDMHSFFKNFSEVECGDIILSDRDHITSKKRFFNSLMEELNKQNYIVTDNSIKGGNITRHFAHSHNNRVNTIQMELRYRAYIDDRYFGNEIVTQWNPCIYDDAKLRLQHAFMEFLKDL